jgi:hypothetical protein
VHFIYAKSFNVEECAWKGKNLFFVQYFDHLNTMWQKRLCVREVHDQTLQEVRANWEAITYWGKKLRALAWKKILSLHVWYEKCPASKNRVITSHCQKYMNIDKLYEIYSQTHLFEHFCSQHWLIAGIYYKLGFIEQQRSFTTYFVKQSLVLISFSFMAIFFVLLFNAREETPMQVQVKKSKK